MRTTRLWWGSIALGVAPATLAQPQPAAQPQARAHSDWLQAMVAAYERNRQALEDLDPRNRKLFGNAEFFKDIDEKDRLVRPADHELALGMASGRIEWLFPKLHHAAEAEGAVNFTTGDVFIRGRSGDFMFAAVQRITDVVMGTS
jgi:hypothetical protein